MQLEYVVDQSAFVSIESANSHSRTGCSGMGVDEEQAAVSVESADPHSRTMASTSTALLVMESFS